MTAVESENPGPLAYTDPQRALELERMAEVTATAARLRAEGDVRKAARLDAWVAMGKLLHRHADRLVEVDRWMAKTEYLLEDPPRTATQPQPPARFHLPLQDRLRLFLFTIKGRMTR